MKNAAVVLLSLFLFAPIALAQTSSFTYQGKLNDAGAAANGPYEMRFRLFDAGTGGVQQPQPTPITLDFTVAGNNAVPVTNGIFTVRLDFTAAGFPGAPRFLEISVRRTVADPWTLLDPRQPVTRAPQSLSADGLSDECNLCVTDAQIESIDAGKVTGVVAIANGGTGSSTQNFVDLTTDQTSIAGNKTFTGVLSLSSGSAATPSMTFSGDTDTGFFRSAPDTLRFSTGGVSRMVIDPNGRIGVGTEISSPIRFFALEDNPSAPAAYAVYGQALGTTGFRAGVVGQSFFTAPQSGQTTGFGVYGFAGDASFNTGLYGLAQGGGALNIGVYGNASGATQNWAGYFVGNTYVSNPGIARAYINSDANAGVALTLNDQPGWSVAMANGGHFQIYNDAIAQNAFWIDRTNNNTGIGTFTPGSKLDVAGSINALTQFNIGGNRILSNPGSINLFAGLNAGFSNVGGAANTFVGDGAGRLNVAGNGNSYFGRAAGENSTGGGNSYVGVTTGQFATGVNNAYFGAGSGRGTSTSIPNTASENAFFGYQSGLVNTSGNLNAFFGAGSGRANTTGFFNAFFGGASGLSNDQGTANAFFGMDAGRVNVNGGANSFFGRASGFANTTGSFNAFLGYLAGQSNTTGSNNTIVGSVANVLADNLEFAAAIGAFARVGANDTIVLGKTAGTYNGTPRPADTVEIPGTLSVAGTINGTVLNATNAVTASNALNLGGVAANQYVQTNDTRLSDHRIPLPNSPNYIQSSPESQQSGSFNIAGNGTIGGVLSGKTGIFTGNVSTTTLSLAGIQPPPTVDANGINAASILDVVAANGGNATSPAPSVFVAGGAGGSISMQAGNGGSGDIGGNGGSIVLNPGRRSGAGPLAGSDGDILLAPDAGTVVIGSQISSSSLALRVLRRAFFETNFVGVQFPDTGGNLYVTKGAAYSFAVANDLVGIGEQIPRSKLHIADNSGQMLFGGGGCGPGHLGIGFAFNLTCSNYSILGNGTETFINRPAGGSIFFREGNATQMVINPGGTVSLFALGTAGGAPLCFNPFNQISLCSSSLRYKQNVNSFVSGLDLINRLRPVSFNWKADKKADVGLVAEEVAEVEPLLATYNGKGEVEGVKYDRIGVVLINVVKEQQAQIEKQQKQIDALKGLICDIKHTVEFCKP